MKLRMGSLFAGYEGLGLAVAQVLDVEPTWVSENEPAPSRILAHHYPDVPNHGDITGIDWSQVEPVDVLTGGFPCQDVSAAGKRAGLKPGTRTGLWSHMAYAIDQLRPRLVVAENVRGLLSAEAHSEVEPCPWCLGDGPASGLRALGAVLADLAALGYDARWCGLRAADIGAPHGRFRVFVVAWPTADADGAACGERRLAAPGQAEGGRARSDAGRRGGAPAADTDGDTVREQPVTESWRGAVAFRRHTHRRGDAPPDANVRRRDVGLVQADMGAEESQRGGLVASDASSQPRPWGAYEPAIRRWERILGRVAPPPTEPGRKGAARLSPRFVEWMQGLPDGWVTDVPGVSRNDQLKALGNGVVPQQAAEAIRRLLDLPATRGVAA